MNIRKHQAHGWPTGSLGASREILGGVLGLCSDKLEASGSTLCEYRQTPEVRFVNADHVLWMRR